MRIPRNELPQYGMGAGGIATIFGLIGLEWKLILFGVGMIAIGFLLQNLDDKNQNF